MTNRDFKLLLSAYFVSTTGDWLYRIALPLLLFELTGAALDMAISHALVFLPFLLFSPIGGVVADRFERRRVLLAGDLASFAMVSLLTLCAALSAPLILIFVFVFLTACVSPVYHPAFQSLIPSIVPDAHLARANSLISSSENIITLIAPVLGGALVAFLGPIPVLMINAGTFIASYLLILPIRAQDGTAAHAAMTLRGVLADMGAGFKLAWSHPVLKYGALLFIGTNFAINIFLANFMYFLSATLRASADMIGVTMAITGAGAIVGSLIAPYFIARVPSGRLIVGATIMAGLATTPMLWVTNALQAGVVWAIASMFSAMNVVTYFTLRQRSVPKAMLGRAVAVTRLISFSSIPIASIAGGLLIEHAGIEAVIALCASIRFLVGSLAAFTPLGSYKEPIPQRYTCS